jgi:hypothetical protein
MTRKRAPKRKAKTHFEQVPLAVVKKLASRAVQKGRTAAAKGRA